MRGLLICFVAYMGALAVAQDPSWPSSFGKSGKEILDLGHDHWVEWYCAPAQGGGRRDAEVTYCLALHERNVALLKDKTQEERGFLEDCRGMFADMAKSAFVAGTSLYPEWDGWGVAIAESSTAVNWAVYEIIMGGGKGEEVTKDDVLTKWRKGLPQALALGDDRKVGRDSYTHLSGVVERLASKFKRRPKSEYVAVMRFCSDMVELASVKRGL